MSDEPTRPSDDEDRRDERLAALLEVPPLDDVSRRRLVRRALDESAGGSQRPGRRARVLAVAAAVVLAILVIGGGTTLILRGDGDDTTVASRTDDARGASEADSAAPSAPVPVGDLGEVADPAVLRDRLAAAAAAPAPAGGEAESILSDAGTACAASDLSPLDLDPPIQIGTGTYSGTPAVIFVGSRDDQRLAVVLDASSCGPLAEVPI